LAEIILLVLIAYVIRKLYLWGKNKDNKSEENELMCNTKDNKEYSFEQHLEKTAKTKTEADKKYNNRAIILDTETTGLSNKDELIELSLLLVKFDKEGYLEPIANYTGLREPNCQIHPRAQAKHGLSMNDLEGKNLDFEICYKIFDKADFLVAHNSSFDKRYIENEFDYLSNKEWFCSYRDIDWKSRGFDSQKLVDLVNEHKIEIKNEHRAKSDTLALFELLNQKASPKTTYFNQLLRNNNIRQKDIDFSNN